MNRLGQGRHSWRSRAVSRAPPPVAMAACCCSPRVYHEHFAQLGAPVAIPQYGSEAEALPDGVVGRI